MIHGLARLVLMARQGMAGRNHGHNRQEAGQLPE
jgi:hypothetical protein